MADSLSDWLDKINNLTYLFEERIVQGTSDGCHVGKEVLRFLLLQSVLSNSNVICSNNQRSTPLVEETSRYGTRAKVWHHPVAK